VNHSLKYKARFFRSHIHQITGAKKEMELSKSMMAQQVRVLDLIPKSSFLLVSGEQGKESSAEYNQGRGGEGDERKGCLVGMAALGRRWRLEQRRRPTAGAGEAGGRRRGCDGVAVGMGRGGGRGGMRWLS
jgi:hypothetical protein